MTAQTDALAQGHAKFLEGWAHHQQGQLGPAWNSYQQAIALHPQHFDALHLSGIIAAQAKLFDQGAELIARALQVDPGNAPAHFNLGNVLADLGRHQEAIASYDRSIALDPAGAEAHNNRGNALSILKQPDAAIAAFERAIAINPTYAEAFNNRGNVLRATGKPEAALESFERAIALRADFAEAHNNRGNALRDLNQYEAALASFDRALSLRPTFAEAFNNRGNTLVKMKRTTDAVADYERALQLKPEYGDALCNLGAAQRLLKRLPAALASYVEAIRLTPVDAKAHNGRGLVLADLAQLEAAIGAFDAALALNPKYAEAHNNRGMALSRLKRHEAARAAYDAAIAVRADYAEAYNNRGVTLRDLGQSEAALASHTRAIEIQPEAPEAYNNRGIMFVEQRRYGEAIADYRRALELKPDYAFLNGALLHTHMQICDWTDYDRQLAVLTARIERGEQASSPFPVLALSDSPALHRRAAEIWTQAEFPPDPVLGAFAPRSARAKIRVGYFSMDFRAHPMPQLLLGMLEAHDRQSFETYIFSYGPDTADAMRQRSRRAVDHFFDVREKSDREIAALARACEIDIAVDLAGYTADSRTGIFALRAAAIQINYLGFPGTMGAAYYDYVIADHVVVPSEQRQFYAEKVVRMPHCYQVNDASRALGEQSFTRADLGLPAVGFVFCCFNNNFKITPEVFSSWMRILLCVEGSVLWLLQDNALVVENLRKEAERRGVDGKRLHFAPRTTQGEHLKRHEAADLFLDTAPYNAHTTSSDALWMGLPVLTQPGVSFPARVAASTLLALDLPELIAASTEEYEARAVELATHPERLAALKAKLLENRLIKPLFDGKLFARHMEAAYRQMAALRHAGLAPDHIDVAG